MGNCALKPKVLTEVGAPAPEQPKEPLLEDHKADATADADKSLSNLFLEEQVGKEKPMSVAEKEKTAPETEDGKTICTDKTSMETKQVIDDDHNQTKEEKMVDVVTSGKDR